MKEDAGRGYRRVVASPKPLDIVEKDTIKAMLSAGIVTISCGGGGVPVIEEKGEMKGVPAVDRKSTRLNSSHANISYAVFCLKKNKKHGVGPRVVYMIHSVE